MLKLCGKIVIDYVPFLFGVLLISLILFLLCLQSRPVEDFYRGQGKLLEFDLPGGIPESWPKLLEALNLDDCEEKQSAAA